jgi:hypothetical protein
MTDLVIVKRAALNVLVIFGTVLPVWIFSILLLARVRDGPQDHVAAGFAFYALTVIVPLLVGGIAQQALLLVIPSSWIAKRQRAWAIGTTLTIPIALLLVGSDSRVLFSPPVFIPLLLGMLLYGSLIRLPRPLP